MKAFMNDKIPLWVVASLGRYVSIRIQFQGGNTVYMPGHWGLLVGIMVKPDEEEGITLLVALDENDLGYMENFLIDEVRPVSDAVLFSLDLDEGYLRQIPSVDADRQ